MGMGMGTTGITGTTGTATGTTGMGTGTTGTATGTTGMIKCFLALFQSVKDNLFSKCNYNAGKPFLIYIFSLSYSRSAINIIFQSQNIN